MLPEQDYEDILIRLEVDVRRMSAVLRLMQDDLDILKKDFYGGRK